MADNISVLAKALFKTDTGYALALCNPDGTPLGYLAVPTLMAQGDILYFDGTNLVRLQAGTAGQVLKTQGTAANPVWVNISSIYTPARALLLTLLGAMTTSISTFLDVATLGTSSRTISKISLQLGTGNTGANFIVTVLKNGSSIGTVTITNGQTTGYSTSFSPATFADGDRLTFNVTQVGSTVAGSNLGIRVEFT